MPPGQPRRRNAVSRIDESPTEYLGAPRLTCPCVKGGRAQPQPEHVHGKPESSALAVVIMAAGKGTRLKSRRPKVLHEIGGKSLLSHVIAAASQIVPPAHIYAVVGHQAEAVKAAVASTGINFVEQTIQRGTGHAVQSARQAIAGYQNILVLSGDAPLIQPETTFRPFQLPSGPASRHDPHLRRARAAHRLRPRHSPRFRLR